MSTKIFHRQIWAHTLSWAIFIIYEISLDVLVGIRLGWKAHLLYYTVSIALFYTNLFLLKLSTGSKRFAVLRTVSILIGEIVLFSMVTIIVSLPRHYMLAFLLSQPMIKYIYVFYRSIYIAALSTGYWLAVRAVTKTREAKESEVAKARLETELLRAQINPHLLFNTLNFMFSKTLQQAPEVSEIIFELSGIMRYALQPAQADGKVPLTGEVGQVKSYIRLNRLRLNERLCIRFTEDVKDVDDYRLPPMLLLTFVENMFKYGNLTEPGDPAQVHIKFEDGTLSFFCWNLKEESRPVNGHGIGIANARQRLAKLYHADGYSLVIDDQPHSFSVSLKLKL